MGGIAIAIGVVRDSERVATADGIDAGHAPSADHLAGDALLGPLLAGTERQFVDRRYGEADRNVARADGPLRPAIVEVLAQHVERPEATPIGRGVIHQFAPGEVRQQREAV